MKKLTAKQKKTFNVISMDTDIQKLWDFLNDGIKKKDIIIWKLACHLANKGLLIIYGGELYEKAIEEGKPITIHGFINDEIDLVGWGFTDIGREKVVQYLHDYGLIREGKKGNLIF